MNHHVSSYFFFVLLLGAAVAVALIFLPFLTPLLIAAAAAVVAFPLYRRISHMFGIGRFRQSLAALITVVLILVVIVVPLFFLVGSIYAEIQSLYGMLTDETNRSEMITVLNNFSQSISHDLFDAFPAYSFDSLNVTEYLKAGLEWVFGNIDVIFSSMAKVGGYVLVFLLATFYFLRDGAILKKRFISWSPLLDSNDEYITHTLTRAIRSVFAGSLAVAVAQGISTGLAFWAFGIPAPALWGSIAAVAALVPGFGTVLLFLPGAVYLFLTGHLGSAIGLVAWGYAAIILIDHTLGPVMINRGVHIHPFLVLLSVLGGLLSFGIIGFIMGPLILVLLFTLLEMYRTGFTDIKAGE